MSYNPNSDRQDPTPKLWRWADPYQHPIPEPEGDPWDTVLKTLIKKDKVQCDAWKDEVQNLLIFAGLFSAVITGFVVDSYKNLQPDLNATAVLLLARIADRLDKASNTSQTTQPSDTPFFTSTSPTPSSIRINTFWFLSLILSLTTVVIGIVCLQWLREHQRYTESLTPKQALAVFHMRAKGLEDWYIPQAFTGLPLILQAAVILFFGGLVDFLISLDPIVAIPVIILVGITLIFLVVTTILPALQCFVVSVSWPSRNGFNISQCPYKSPQSWAFRNLIILGMQTCAAGNQFLKNIGGYSFFAAISHTFAFIFANMAIRNDSNLTSNISTSPSLHLPSDNRSIPHLARRLTQMVPITMCLDPEHGGWIDFDSFWLTIRDTHFQLSKGRIKPAGEASDGICPPYDLVQALAHSVLEQSVKEPVVLAAYHCFRAISFAIVENREGGFGEQAQSITRTRMQYLQSCFFPSSDFKSLSSSLDKPNLNMMHDETMLLFLDLPGISQYANNPKHPVGMNFLQRHTRIWLYIFNHFPDTSVAEFEIDIRHPFLVRRNFSRRPWEIPENVLRAMAEQLYMKLSRIFEQAYNLGPGDPQISIPGYRMLNEFMAYVACFRPPPTIEPLFLSVLGSISKGLNLALQSQGFDRTDFLFFSARLYLEELADHPWFSDLMKSGPYDIVTPIFALLKDMLRYEHQLDRSQYATLHNSWMSGFLSHHFSRVRVQTVGSSYISIPEKLLRFLPYESRPENTTESVRNNKIYNPESGMVFRTRDVVVPNVDV